MDSIMLVIKTEKSMAILFPGPIKNETFFLLKKLKIKNNDVISVIIENLLPNYAHFILRKWISSFFEKQNNYNTS